MNAQRSLVRRKRLLGAADTLVIETSMRGNSNTQVNGWLKNHGTLGRCRIRRLAKWEVHRSQFCAAGAGLAEAAFTASSAEVAAC